MALEDIFAGAGDVKVGGQFATLPQFKSVKVGDDWVTRESTDLVVLTRLEAFTAKRSGQDFVSAEFRVVQHIEGGTQAREEGVTYKHMWALERTRTNELTERGKYEMQRCRRFFEAMFGQAGIAVDDSNVGKLMAVSCKGAMGAKVDAADAAILGLKEGDDYPSPLGTQLIARTLDEQTRSDKEEHKGKSYYAEYWQAPPKAA